MLPYAQHLSTCVATGIDCFYGILRPSISERNLAQIGHRRLCRVQRCLIALKARSAS